MPFDIIITIKCVCNPEAWFENIDSGILESMGIALIENSKKKKKKQSPEKSRCSLITGGHQMCGLKTSNSALCFLESNVRPTSAIFRYAGVYFHHLFMCDFCSTRNDNTNMLHFQLFALFWYHISSNGARCAAAAAAVGGHPGERRSETRGGRGAHRKGGVALFIWAQLLLYEKDSVVEKWDTWGWSHVFFLCPPPAIGKL